MSQQSDKEKVNQEIDYPQVRLLLQDGSQHGIVSSQEALRMAAESGLDLVEVSSAAKPPVVRIMDYGKHKFEKNKRDKELRKKQRQTQADIKELKFRPKIDEHDFNVKLKHIKRFILDGDKVKLVIRYRGREIVFQSSGIELLDRIVKELEELIIVEKKPEMMGKQQIMVIAPKPGLDKEGSKNAKAEDS